MLTKRTRKVARKDDSPTVTWDGDVIGALITIHELRALPLCQDNRDNHKGGFSGSVVPEDNKVASLMLAHKVREDVIPDHGKGFRSCGELTFRNIGSVFIHNELEFEFS